MFSDPSITTPIGLHQALWHSKRSKTVARVKPTSVKNVGFTHAAIRIKPWRGLQRAILTDDRPISSNEDQNGLPEHQPV